VVGSTIGKDVAGSDECGIRWTVTRNSRNEMHSVSYAFFRNDFSACVLPEVA